MGTKNDALEKQQLLNEILTAKKLELEIHWIDQSENQKLLNEVLTTKKLKQETHWLKSALLPAIQILAALLLALVTYIIGTNTNILKSETTKLEIEKDKNEKEAILNTNAKILQSIELTRTNDSLSDIKKQLENKKSSLWLQIGALDKANKNLDLKINTSKIQNELLLSHANKLYKGLSMAQNKLDSTNNAITFKESEYNLASVKKSSWTNNPAVGYLINEIQTNPKIAQRIVDSLVIYRQLPNPNLFGVCDFILYFSTGDERVIEDIKKQMTSDFNIKKDARLFFSDILMNDAWSDDRRYEFLTTYFEILKKESSKQKQVFILNEIAQFQALHELSLVKFNFNDFIYYIKKCRELSDDYIYDSAETVELNKKVVNCIAIVCPQIFVANYLDNIGKAKPMASGKIDSALIKKININYLYAFEILSDKTKNRIDTLFQAMDFNEKLQGQMLYELVKKNRPIIRYWQKVYNGEPFDADEVKRKVVNNEM